MQSFVVLDTNIINLLCCPLCKGALKTETSRFLCDRCSSSYVLVDAPGGQIYDFRIHHPSYVIPPSIKQWRLIQGKYESHIMGFSQRDNLQEY